MEFCLSLRLSLSPPVICLASVRVLNLLGSRLAPARPGGGWDRAENIPLLLGSSLSSLKFFWWAHHELPAVYTLWGISNDINDLLLSR